jgi:hypothetical protein
MYMVLTNPKNKVVEVTGSTWWGHTDQDPRGGVIQDQRSEVHAGVHNLWCVCVRSMHSASLQERDEAILQLRHALDACRRSNALLENQVAAAAAAAPSPNGKAANGKRGAVGKTGRVKFCECTLLLKRFPISMAKHSTAEE